MKRKQSQSFTRDKSLESALEAGFSAATSVIIIVPTSESYTAYMHISSIGAFKKCLKTHLLKAAFD